MPLDRLRRASSCRGARGCAHWSGKRRRLAWRPIGVRLPGHPSYQPTTFCDWSGEGRATWHDNCSVGNRGPPSLPAHRCAAAFLDLRSLAAQCWSARGHLKGGRRPGKTGFPPSATGPIRPGDFIRSALLSTATSRLSASRSKPPGRSSLSRASASAHRIERSSLRPSNRHVSPIDRSLAAAPPNKRTKRQRKARSRLWDGSKT